jgi:ABC-type multidrug transport system fused ATPase/permease subunit
VRREIRNVTSLFDRSTRVRFGVALVGSVVIAGIEIIGLALVFPLLTLLTDPNAPDSAPISAVRDVLGDPTTDELTAILGAVIIASFVLRTLLTVALRWWTLGFTLHREAQVSAHLLDLYLHAPYRVHLQRNSAEFLRTLESATEIAFTQSVGSSVNIVTEGAVIIGITLVVLVLQPVVAIATTLYFVLIILVYQRVLNRKARELGVRYQEIKGESYVAIQQALGGVKEVIVRNCQRFFVDRYARSKVQSADVQRRYQFIQELPRQYLETAFILGAGLLALVLALTSSDDVLPVLGLFIAAGFRLLPTLYRFVSSLTTFRIGLGSVDLVVTDISELERAIDQRRPPGDHAVIGALRDELVLDGVSFAYDDGGPMVLDDLSMAIRRGESVALVGPSGAGKSTLVDVIMGLHPAQRGRVQVDGVDIASDLEDWQRQIGLVPQDVYLLDATLRSNVAFGVASEEIDEDAVASAIERAQLGPLVESLPEGLDTVVGERGVRVSGGQRQRLGVARALYADPQVLVLDEATSALDNVTEAQLAATMHGLKGALTMIVIAHRLSTVKNCDRVYFMEHGRVAASGSFEELLELSPAFAELAELARLP